MKPARSEGTTHVLGQMPPLHGTLYSPLLALRNQERIVTE